MIRGSIGVKVDAQAVSALTTAPDGPVYRALQRGAAITRDRAKVNLTQAGRVDTGRLRQATTSKVEVRGTEVVGLVESDVNYATAIHNGTGVYGPKGAPIVPTTARVLRFKPKGSTTFVFARSVQGVEPTPYLTEALDRLTAADLKP